MQLVPRALGFRGSCVQPGDHSLDDVRIRTFVDRESGDAVEGWETFVTDPAGSASLEPGSHTVAIKSEGGDGCVEIDFLRVVPIDALIAIREF